METILISFFCNLLWFTAFNGQIPLEDVNTKAMGSSAQNGAKVLLFNYVEPKLTLIDMSTASATVVDDTRYLIMSAEVLAWDKGFLLIDRTTKRVTTMDDKGHVTSQKPLPPRSGDLVNAKLGAISREKSGRMLVNLWVETKVILCYLDLAKETWKELSRHDLDPKRDPQWLAVGNQWVEVETVTGRLSMIDPANPKAKRLIFKGRDPVKKSIGRSPYHGILETLSMPENACNFTYKSFDDVNGKRLSEPQIHGLILKDGKCFETPMVLLGQHNGLELAYNYEERMLVIGDPMKRVPVAAAR